MSGPVRGKFGMTSTMKAAVKSKAAPKSTEIRTVPIPSVGPTEVLIRVKVASICGTDVHIYDWDAWAQARIKVPQIDATFTQIGRAHVNSSHQIISYAVFC